jgi:hypothetical protein
MIRYPHDLFLGAREKTKIRSREFELQPGDCLFVYTDGEGSGARFAASEPTGKIVSSCESPDEDRSKVKAEAVHMEDRYPVNQAAEHEIPPAFLLRRTQRTESKRQERGASISPRFPCLHVYFFFDIRLIV